VAAIAETAGLLSVGRILWVLLNRVPRRQPSKFVSRRRRWSKVISGAPNAATAADNL